MFMYIMLATFSYTTEMCVAFSRSCYQMDVHRACQRVEPRRPLCSFNTIPDVHGAMRITKLNLQKSSHFANSIFISRFEMRRAVEAAVLVVCSEVLVPEASFAKVKSSEEGRERKSEEKKISEGENEREENSERKERKTEKRGKPAIAEYIDPVVGYAFEFDPTRFEMAEVVLSLNASLSQYLTPYPSRLTFFLLFPTRSLPRIPPFPP